MELAFDRLRKNYTFRAIVGSDVDTPICTDSTTRSGLRPSALLAENQASIFKTTFRILFAFDTEWPFAFPLESALDATEIVDVSTIEVASA